MKKISSNGVGYYKKEGLNETQIKYVCVELCNQYLQFVRRLNLHFDDMPLWFIRRYLDLWQRCLLYCDIECPTLLTTHEKKIVATLHSKGKKYDD